MFVEFVSKFIDMLLLEYTAELRVHYQARLSRSSEYDT
jgi:hypothetical protein